MKYLAAMFLVAASATASLAEAPCKSGNPNIFKFISWDVKPGKDEGGNDFAAFTLTFHNTLDKNLITATFGAAVNDKDGKPIENISFHLEKHAKASSDHTETFEYGGFPAEDIARMQGTTPVLCAWQVVDENNQTTDFLAQ